MVEGLRGHVYEKPVPAMRAYLNGITKGEAGAARFPDLHRGAGAADAEAVGADDAGRGAVQHHPEAYGGGGEDTGAGQVAGDRAEGYDRNRSGRRLGRWGGRNCRATWCWTITAMPGWAWGSPRRTCRMAGRMRSSTQMVLWGTADQVKAGVAGAFRRRGNACGDPAGACGWGYRRAGRDAGGAGGHVNAGGSV